VAQFDKKQAREQQINALLTAVANGLFVEFTEVLYSPHYGV
jgi:hypothetical protein